MELAGERDKPATLETLAAAVPHAEGPRGVIAYWRARMHRLTAIVEQLRSRECRLPLSILTHVAGRAAGGGAGAGSAPGSPMGGSSVGAGAIALSPAGTAGGASGAAAASTYALLRRWRAMDVRLTEVSNEAKDNVKYLATLSRFVEPLYSGTPLEAIDALPALFNAIKMVFTIARYFNTPERMSDLFVKATHALIANCKRYILATPGPGGEEVPDPDSPKALWSRDVPALIARLQDCLKLSEAYSEDVRLMRQSLAATPGARRMDGLADDAIFRPFDLFCRRVIKLVDTFATAAQFDALAAHNLEGLDGILAAFSVLLEDFKRRRHDLLAYEDSSFDR